MRLVPTILFVWLVLCSVHPAAAGGAWPRGQGKVFASVSWTTFGDVMGYMEAIQQPYFVDEIPELVLTDEIGIYAEYGLTKRLTFGVDRFHRPETEVGSTIWFLRGSLGRLDWQNKYAMEIGYGPDRDWRGKNDSALRVGASWGRSYESRWGDGWIDLDAKAGQLMRSRETFWKVESTLGLNPTDKSLIYLQLQTGAIGDNPSFLRTNPSYVRRLGHGISLESTLLLGVKNDDTQGVKVGAWLEF